MEPTMCDPSVLDPITSQDISRDVKTIISKVTAHIKTLPVGTFKYKIFKYPGDVDIFEKLSDCCTYNISRNNAASTIVDIVTNIADDPHLLFTEFKAGYDNRFKIYTGIINEQIEDYDPHMIRRDINNLYTSGIIDGQHYSHILFLVKDNPTIPDVINLNEELRKYWVVRWTQDEVLQGYKLLPGNYKLYLNVALTQGSIVKLDIVAPITHDEPRYVEVTNFFVIAMRDKYGKEIVLSEELTDYEQSLLEDVHKYYEKNLLKSVKRLWMYLAFKGRICDLSRLKDLFSSDIAFHGQLLSDIELAIFLLESILPYDKDFLMSTMETRLAKLNGLCVGDKIYPTPGITVKNLNILYDCLLKDINEQTLAWLNDRSINIIGLTN